MGNVTETFGSGERPRIRPSGPCHRFRLRGVSDVRGRTETIL